MDATRADKERTCPKCGAEQNAGEICARCGLVFAKYRPPVSGWSVAPPPEKPETRASAPVFVEVDEPARKIDALNIIALLMLIDSTLALFAKVPAISDTLASEAGFHQKAKFLYDLLTNAGMFVSVVGVLLRKEWARISMVVLLALGLAEGLYMLAYMHVTVPGLEKDLDMKLPDVRRNMSAKWIGCALYAYFIYILNTSRVKERFRYATSL